MTSSGIKRGVATAAISALAVAGLPLLAGTASATPISSTLGADAVDLYVPDSSSVVLSTKNDGTNTTQSLVAGGGTNVTSVLFQYTVDGGTTWVNVPGGNVARNADGVFQVDFTPVAGTNGIRAVPNTGVGNADGETVTLDNTANAVEMATEGSLGVFQAPYVDSGEDGDYVAVTGTVSDTTTSVTVFGSSHTGFNQAANVDSATDTFNLDFDISGYPYSPGAEPNQIALAAFTEDVAEDGEGSTLYVQTIGSITATPETQERANPANSEITLTVLDTTGQPVAHAEVGVADLDTDGAGPDTDGPDTILGYTDGNGQIVDTTQTTAGTFTYFANTTDNDEYQPGTDPADTATVTTYTPAFSTIDIVNERNRSNFDRDEVAPADSDDFTIVTKDQRGNAINEDLAGADVEYRFIRPDGTTSAWIPAETDANGEAVIVNDSATQEGTYTIEARRPNVAGVGLTNATPEVYDTSDAAITFDEGSDANAPVNGDVTVVGNLGNDDGGLAGRRVELNYTPAISVPAGDADFAPQSAQPAGTDVSPDAGGPGSTVSAITDANGDFSVVLRDPDIPDNVTPDEEDGTLAADAFEAAMDNTDLNADNSIDVHWIVLPDVSRIELDVDTIVGGAFGPGRPADVEVEVFGQDGDTNPANDPVLSDYPISVEVDKGFLTPYDGTGANGLTLAEGQDDDGDLWGFFENLGTSVDTSTGDDAIAQIAGAIERDVDFDDNGLTEMTVTVTAGEETESASVTMDSRNAINVGSTDLPRDESEPAGAVDVGDEVDLNFDVIDQYGNLSGDEQASVTDDSTVADFQTEFDGDQVRSDFTTSGPSITAFSDAPTTQVLMAMFQANEYLVDNNGNLDAGSRTATADSDPIVWGATVRRPIDAVLKGRNTGADTDKLKVVTTPRGRADGAVVNLYKFNKNGVRVLIESSTLNANGIKRFQVVDNNGRKFTKYVARVKRTDDSKGVKRTNFKRVR